METIAIGRILFNNNESKNFKVYMNRIPKVYLGESNVISVKKYMESTHDNIKEMIIDDVHLDIESVK